MEAITLVTIFFGYYIGCDMYYYFSRRQNHEVVTRSLNSIEHRLDTIETRLRTIAK